MGQELTKLEMALQLHLMVVKRYAMQILSVVTFHIALPGTIVIFALSVI